jgi:hypothetical protein
MFSAPISRSSSLKRISSSTLLSNNAVVGYNIASKFNLYFQPHGKVQLTETFKNMDKNQTPFLDALFMPTLTLTYIQLQC